MEQYVTEAMVNLGVELTKLAVKGTATAVATKITTIKNSKNLEEVRKTYDELIDELLSERAEAVRIAQSYKSELERVEISDKDIEHLHNTVSRVLEILNGFSSEEDENGNVTSKYGAFEPLKELINIDTLKTMQLLGFNYRVAIGEPLTKLCADAISSLATKRGQVLNKGKR